MKNAHVCVVYCDGRLILCFSQHFLIESLDGSVCKSDNPFLIVLKTTGLFSRHEHGYNEKCRLFVIKLLQNCIKLL